LFAPGRLDAAERAAKFFNFAFVGELLAFGDLDEFKHFVELVNHLLERLGDLRGVRDGFADGRGFGGPEIGGLGPLTLRWRFRSAFGPAKFRSAATRRFTRRFGSPRWFRRMAGFRDGFGLVGWLRSGFVRGKFSGHFRVRFAKIAGGISFVFRVLGVFRRFGCRRAGFNGFRRG